MSEAKITKLKLEIAGLKSENTQLMKKVADVEQGREEYLQNVSHQIVAPLNAMKWHIENLTEGRVGVVRAKKVLRSIYAQATIAVHLAKNFKLMSNLEGDHALHKLKEPLQEVNLRSLLVNIADDFQPLAWDKNIKIHVDDDCFDKDPSVLAMKPLISQVFSNIIENAVKYSDSDTHIQFRGQYLQASDSFSVSIINSGIDLATEHFGKVFDRGFRSAKAIQKYPAGTGFGLYIARRIVEIHEGTIKASTDRGHVIFEVILPVKALKGKARLRD